MATQTQESQASWAAYNLPRNKDESSRLEVQHNLYLANTGYYLHPRFAQALPEDAHIAEVATGTGIWLRELAEKSPSTWSFTGLDLSPDQFPPKEQHGKCSFQLLNILEPIPPEHQAKYDVVHVRLLVCGLVGKDWQTVANHLRPLLKPGGWLQWQESFFEDIDILGSQPGTPMTNLRELRRISIGAMTSVGKLLTADVNEIPQTVTAAGFENCEYDEISSDKDPSTRPVAGAVGLPAWASMLKRGVEQKLPFLDGWTNDQVDNLIAKAGEELANDQAYLRWTMMVVIGQRPR